MSHHSWHQVRDPGPLSFRALQEYTGRAAVSHCLSVCLTRGRSHKVTDQVEQEEPISRVYAKGRLVFDPCNYTLQQWSWAHWLLVSFMTMAGPKSAGPQEELWGLNGTNKKWWTVTR